MKTPKEIEQLAEIHANREMEVYKSMDLPKGTKQAIFTHCLVSYNIAYTQCQEDLSPIKFAEWLNDTNWIRRPFEEESGIYLYDDHSEEIKNDIYVNPKTINELYDIFKSTH